jgi:rRNA maturation RNase YbeY
MVRANEVRRAHVAAITFSTTRDLDAVFPAVAARNAPEHAGSYEDEMALLIVHGILHLLGMDHLESEEAEAMETRERELLDRFHKRS